MLYLWKAKEIQGKTDICEGKKNKMNGKQFQCVIEQKFAGNCPEFLYGTGHTISSEIHGAEQ